MPHDHDEILDGDGVIRRISEHHVIFDKSGKRKISSAAMQASSGYLGGMSVDLEEVIRSAGIDPIHYVTSPEWMGSIRFAAGQLRAEELQVGFAPLIPENPYHGEVWGNFSKGKVKRLLKVAEWFVKIEGVLLGAE